jgi:hypothetical protein
MAKIRLNIANITWLERARDFIEMYQFPVDLLLDVVKSPESIKLDPSSADKGYKVLQFRRGDISVVVGLRDPEHPTVIHVWLHGVEEGVDHSVRTGKATGWGSGGASKTPKSPQQLRGWLQSEGCTLAHNGRGHYNVYWNDVLLGGIGSTMQAQAVMNDYSFIRRRLATERARASLTEEN